MAKACRRDGGHTLFWSTPHNESSYHFEYMDIMYSEIDNIAAPKKAKKLKE